MSSPEEFRRNGRSITHRIIGRAILAGGGYAIFAGCIPPLALSYAGPPAYALLCAYLYFGFNEKARDRLRSRISKMLLPRVRHDFN